MTEHQINSKRLSLYYPAFTHSSYTQKQETVTNYEKLEFFGDAILGFLTAEFLYQQNMINTLTLGSLSRAKHFLVSKATLNQLAIKLQLKDLILKDQCNLPRINASLLSDVFEAFIGALYSDQGLLTTRAFLTKHLFLPFYSQSLQRIDYCSILQELAQKNNKTIPSYSFQEEDKQFLVTCQYNNLILVAKANSKKTARAKVARLMLEKLG